MAKHLKQITAPVSGYLKHHFSFAFQGKSQHKGNTLKPIIELAFLQGEALLRQVFFKYLQQRNIDDADTQLHFWKQFQQGAEVFNLFCQMTGLVNAFKTQVSIEYQRLYSKEQLQYTAYCCLLWDLHCNKQASLLNSCSNVLFNHYITSLFPSKSTQLTADQLKREIRKLLAEQWHLRIEIRESFRSENEKVNFSLVAKVSGYHPKTLITLEGKRLKTTRIAACKQLLSQLQKSLQIETPVPRTPKKSQKILPLQG